MITAHELHELDLMREEILKKYEDDKEVTYLEYVNNFLSVRKMAEYYELNELRLLVMIDEGRKINHKRKEEKTNG